MVFHLTSRASELRCDKINHTSSNQFPERVDAYLQEEVKLGAIMGPYVNHPIQNAHFSPFMMCEKSDVAARRVIIVLSWPKDAFVNLGIDKSAYRFQSNIPNCG